MTIVAVTYRYTDDLATRERVLPEHRDYLRGLADQGLLLVAGPNRPDESPGALLLFRADKATVNALIEKDPFTTCGVIVKAEVVAWEPLIGPVVAALRQ